MSKALNKVVQNVNIESFSKEKLFTASNLVVMTLTFLVFGLFVLIEVLSQTALSKLEKEATVTMFFRDDFGESQILALKSQIEKDERVHSVKYVSKNDAFDIFKELNKDEPLLLESVTASVLPASLEVRAVKVSLLNVLSGEYSTLDGVEGVKFFKDIIERFNFWRGVLSLAVGAVLAILLFVSFSIVVSTVRTAISLRGTEFEILKLVGASDAYVKNPLIYQGVLYGGVSAFIAGLVYAVLVFVALFSGFLGSLGISDFALVSNVTLPAWVFAIVLTLVLTLCGVLLGYVSSTSAIKKYLSY